MQVDWFRVINELEQAGVTLRAQADAADVVLGTVYYWKTGGEPKHRNGRLLIALYEEQTGREAPLKSTGGGDTYRSPVYIPRPQLQTTTPST